MEGKDEFKDVMNVKIYIAKEDIGKVSGIMHAVERLYTEIEVEEEAICFGRPW